MIGVIGVCTHHWVLETPTAGKATIGGVCRTCGERKNDFSAWGPSDEVGEWRDGATKGFGRPVRERAL